jgi:DNA repair protein RadC
MKYALLAGATCFVLVHNHPSGSPRPSVADNDLTQRVKRVGEVMNIRMIDHVILTDGDYYSYAENGKI